MGIKVEYLTKLGAQIEDLKKCKECVYDEEKNYTIPCPNHVELFARLERNSINFNGCKDRKE